MAYQPEIQVARLIIERGPFPNMLRQAAQSPTANDALVSLRTMLLLPEDPATTALIDPVTWRRATGEQRLVMVASWFQAECFAEIERMNTLVECARPMDTVKTND